jgi:hypothetical protein
MTIFRFDLETKNFYEITTRNGGSNKLKWTTLIRQVYLKDVQFGVCQHPFDPEKTSFRRKPFSIYTDKDYGIAIKGTELSQEDYDNVVASSKGKVNSLVNRLFWRHGATFWQSYPNLVKSYEDNGTFDLVRSNPNSHGTAMYESHRKFPTWNLLSNGNAPDKPMYFQPYPVKAMRLNLNQHYQIFNEGATAKTWWEHHDMINPLWRNIIQAKLDAAA